MDLEDRYQNILAKADSVRNDYEGLKEEEKELEQKIDGLDQERMILEKVSELFKFLLNKYVYEYAESFSEIVSEGLQSIYYDQNVSFGVDVEQKRGKVNVHFKTEHDGRRGDPLTSFGGGLAEIESLVLRVLVILKSNLARYLFMDEALSAVADKYVGTCSKFLSEISKNLGVNILLVTHNQEFIEEADNAYRGELDDNGHLQLNKIR